MQTDAALLVSLADGAKRLCVSERTLHRIINRGEIRTCHIARRHLVPVAELERYVASLTSGQTS